MPINIVIPDDFFNDDQKTKLMALFGVTDDAQFSDALGRVILAALEEYREMFLGMGMPSRASEIREYRLYHLIKYFFRGRIPDELDVSSMFQLPESRSKNLILYVLTRFRYDLKDEILNTLKQIALEAELDRGTGEYHVYIGSQNMVEELDQIIQRAGIKYKKLTKNRNESNMYSISPNSYMVICNNLQIEPKVEKAKAKVKK